MRVLALFALTAGVALLGGCGGAQPPTGAPGMTSQAPARAARAKHNDYRIVYSFVGGANGAYPDSSLVDLDGTLYGTTRAGGGGGTVFSVTTDGTENVVYRFHGRGHPDGSHPNSVIGAADILYGTAANGGSSLQRGTVFKVAPSGTENLIYAFNASPDGDHPLGVIDVRGKLYGTTAGGGKYGCGTVFSVNMAGKEHVLYSFLRRKLRRDGCHPNGNLVEENDTFYGTTVVGGTYQRGTVFAITTGGAEKVLYDFGNGPDGAFPKAGLVDADGTLYGTNRYVAFSISPSGSLTVLHVFGSYHDGAYPEAPLIDVNGTLYGTTELGGKYCSQTFLQPGCGTVFSMTPSGTETVLHSFGAQGDGFHPVAGLIDIEGTLYGTAIGGGPSHHGIVFAITP